MTTILAPKVGDNLTTLVTRMVTTLVTRMVATVVASTVTNAVNMLWLSVGRQWSAR